MTKKKRDALAEYNSLIYSPEIQQTSRADLDGSPKLYTVKEGFLQPEFVIKKMKL